MLQADKQDLERELAQSLVNLEWKELDYLSQNMRNLATSSAVLVGFGFFRAGAGLDLDDLYGPDENIFAGGKAHVFDNGWRILAIVMEGFIGTTLSLAISFNLITLFVATVSAMTGPGLALRGPEGSVGRAVKHMEKQNQRALRFFGRGITAFTIHLTLLAFRSWFGLGFIDGMTGVMIGLYTIWHIHRYGADICERFYVSPTHVVRGAFMRGEDGMQHWVNTADEVRQSSSPELCNWPCWRAMRQLVAPGWRPPGTGRFMPLWRLDKAITFPSLDDDPQRSGQITGPWAPIARQNSGGVHGRGAQGQRLHREAVEDLLLRMQGPSTHQAEAAAASPSSSARLAAAAAQYPAGVGMRPAAATSGAVSHDLLETLAQHMAIDGRPLLSGHDGRSDPQRRSGGPWWRGFFGGGEPIAPTDSLKAPPPDSTGPRSEAPRPEVAARGPYANVASSMRSTPSTRPTSHEHIDVEAGGMGVAMSTDPYLQTSARASLGEGSDGAVLAEPGGGRI